MWMVKLQKQDILLFYIKENDSRRKIATQLEFACAKVGKYIAKRKKKWDSSIAGNFYLSWNTFTRRCCNAMMDEIVYSANEVYKRLGISDSTLRKYMEMLQREGFTVKKDKRGRREYTENDIMIIEKLIELSKHDGMTLEKAAKMITQKLESINPDLVSNDEKSKETDLIPFHIQQQLEQQYSVIAQKMNQGMLMMEQRLSEQANQINEEIKESIEQHHERVEKRLEARDETLMKTLREMQEAKRLMQDLRNEVAADKEQKKPWWKFW